MLCVQICVVILFLSLKTSVYSQTRCPYQCFNHACSDNAYSCIDGMCCIKEEFRCEPDNSCKDFTRECVSNSVCRCKSNYYSSGNKVKCVKRPELGEQCNAQFFLHGSCMTPNSNCISGKCQCFDGFIADGKKCSRIRKQIGNACNKDAECVGSYTFCDSKNTCQCMEGCVEKNNNCICSTFNCPFGDLQLKNGKPVQCTLTQDLSTNASTVTQTCDNNFYCVLDPNWGLAKGFCCPVPPTICPRGTAKLMQNDPFDCPRASHYYSYDSFRGIAVCCPKSCKLEDIFVSGKCLPVLKLGETCTRNEQCTEHLTECKNMFDSKVKKCACSNNTVEHNGHCRVPYCKWSSISPLLNKQGVLVTCIEDKNCGNTSYMCQKDLFNVCCKKFETENTCPDGMGDPLGPCNPMGLTCPPGSNCVFGNAPNTYTCCEG